MKNKIIIIISCITLLATIIFGIVMHNSSNTGTSGYIPEDTESSSTDNIKIIHEIDYIYNDNPDYIERDWLISDEPIYMSGVLEACATVIESYYNMNVPCKYEYSNSSDYSYANGGDVCLLTPSDNTLNSMIVEIIDNKVFLYEIQSRK